MRVCQTNPIAVTTIEVLIPDTVPRRTAVIGEADDWELVMAVIIVNHHAPHVRADAANAAGLSHESGMYKAAFSWKPAPPVTACPIPWVL